MTFGMRPNRIGKTIAFALPILHKLLSHPETGKPSVSYYFTDEGTLPPG